MREKAMTRVRQALEKVRARVAAGRLKDPAKIGAAVERVLQRNQHSAKPSASHGCVNTKTPIHTAS